MKVFFPIFTLFIINICSAAHIPTFDEKINSIHLKGESISLFATTSGPKDKIENFTISISGEKIFLDLKNLKLFEYVELSTLKIKRAEGCIEGSSDCINNSSITFSYGLECGEGDEYGRLTYHLNIDHNSNKVLSERSSCKIY